MASLAVLVCAQVAQAENYDANTNNADWKGDEKGAIDALPKMGRVTIIGTVESVDNDKKRFVISDNTDDTIDIHTNSPVQVKEGDNVKVTGEMQSEVAGMGKEITSADVQINK